MLATSARLRKLEACLACPSCGGDLDSTIEALTCRGCAAVYPRKGGKIYFTTPPSRTDEFDSLKARLKKRLGKWYHNIGVDIIAPTYPFDYLGTIQRSLDIEKQIVVDIGCGNHRIHADIVGLDIFDYDAVDIVCDLASLPFKPESVDAFVSRSVLEHVPEPENVVRGTYRCTRNGGLALHLIPFLFPFHASPHDYKRFTHKGLEQLFRGWEIVEQRNATGPVTLILLVVIELLSIVVSLGREKIKAYVYLLLCLALFPLKYLDALFVNRHAFLVLAPSILTIARKPLHGDGG